MRADGLLDALRRTPLRGPVDIVERRVQQGRDLARDLTHRVVVEIVAMVDVDAVVDRVDIDRIIDRVDLDRIIDRLDLDAIVARVEIDAVARRLDVDAVAGRLDVNAVVERVDLERIVDRFDAMLDDMDMPTVTRHVVDAGGIEDIIRESTVSVSGEMVDALRMKGADADRLVNRLVDSLLLRRKARARVDGEVPGGSGTLPGAAPAEP